REKEAIFARTWHYIGHESHVRDPGDYLTLEIADESVFVMRGDDGRLRGFYNVCRHRAHRLLDGAGNAATIVCPYHAWSYRCDGSLRHARFADRMEDFNPEEFRLPQVRVESLGGLLFVNLDARAPSVAEVAAGMADDLRAHVPRLGELRPIGSFAFDAGGAWKANWKVVVDNYVECYHCAKAHPALADLMVMGSYRHEVHEHWARQLSPRVRSDSSAYRVEEGDDVQVAAYWYLWPTTSIWLVPGAANLFVLAMMPGGHETTVFSGHRYATDDAPDPARTAYLNETLGPEDQGLCESVQRGLRSRSYDQGRLMVDPARSGTAEHGVHQFHRLVTRALDDGSDR
ncbi:MAG: aromatic ring-hydroxylating dioxygenase subunit alpha, partial [Chromatiales bacterium]|nr:aromatic ring-hydroxylating dioxygenase subunit alpha [Chromatiales bacterium]